ncbi:MAG: AraC family transcriptional regulator [Parvularculaceae bacterium]|nr:AraC family transcriptional regulator [Parvularculaceae bacterium]
MGEASYFLGTIAGITTGAVGVAFGSLLRARAAADVTSYGAIFCIGIIVVAFEEGMPAPYGFYCPVFAAAMLSGGLWAFSLRLFGLNAPRVVILGPLGAMLAISSFAAIPALEQPLMVAHRITMISIGLAVVVMVLLSEKDDLDPMRRRIRRPFVGVIGLWVAFSSGLGGLAQLGYRPDWLVPADEIGTAVLAIVGGLLFTLPREALFAPPKPKGADPAPQPNVDQAILARLDRLMREEKAWQEEGLTVRSLAERLGMQEHQLRPLINQQLGYRNFATFVNEHRLAEAKKRLRAAEHASENIATIAYACGFGSLGPFGRAFKENTGLTPTAYRKAHQNL